MTTERTRTADDFAVSTITGMCDHHEGEALTMVVLTLRGGGNLADIEQQITEHREICVESCGTLVETGVR